MGGVSCKQQTTDPQILVVNFDSDGGSEVTKQEVKVGDKATKPKDPTKEGYTFVAWKNGEEVYDFEKEVTSNLNLKAEWKAVENTSESGSTGGESGSTGGNSGTTADPNVLKVKLSTSTAANGATKGDIKLNDDGSVSYTAVAQYSGGGYYFYINEDKSAIKLEDYESINIVFDYEAGAWKEGAKEPQWCLNVLPEGGSFWEGAKTLKYFGGEKKGSITFFV